MEIPRVELLLQDGQNRIPVNVPVHEIPLLIHSHGGNRNKLKFIGETGETMTIHSFEAEFDRLGESYRSEAEGGRLWVEAAYQDALQFEGALRSGRHLETLEAIKAESNEAALVQPKQDQDGYLHEDQLRVMLKALGAKAPTKNASRNLLRGMVMISLEEAARVSNVAIGDLDTDPQMQMAYDKWLSAQQQAPKK